MTVALIIVDVQSDFLPGGALGVTDGDKVIAPLLALAEQADIVIATRDFHPAKHVSFASSGRGGVWPDHCEQGTPGAELNPLIDRIAQLIVSKGTDLNKDAMSGFDGTQLAEMLRARGVDEVWIGGLATDYCVKFTALDAAKAGFKVTVFSDAIRAVDLQAGDGGKAIAEMKSAAVRVAEMPSVLRSLVAL